MDLGVNTILPPIVFFFYSYMHIVILKKQSINMCTYLSIENLRFVLEKNKSIEIFCCSF